MKLRYLVIDTGNWLPGKKVVLSTAWISSVAPERETVVMNIEKKRIQEAPKYKPDADWSREYETRLHDSTTASLTTGCRATRSGFRPA
jgi:hypothetical protein